MPTQEFNNWPLDKKVAYIESDQQLSRRYQKALAFCLGYRWLVKKFGEKTYDDFTSAGLDNAVYGMEPPDNEIRRVELEFEACQNVEQAKLIAKANGLEITDEDVKNAREAAIEGMFDKD